MIKRATANPSINVVLPPNMHYAIHQKTPWAPIQYKDVILPV